MMNTAEPSMPNNEANRANVIAMRYHNPMQLVTVHPGTSGNSPCLGNSVILETICVRFVLACTSPVAVRLKLPQV
jgi:hypothetical protein